MAPVAAIVMVGFSSSVSDSDGSMERLGLPERAKHEMGDVGARNEEAAPQILPVRRAVGAGHGLVGQPWRSYDGPVPAPVAKDGLHQCGIRLGWKIGRAHSCTPGTNTDRMPSFPCKKKRKT